MKLIQPMKMATSIHKPINKTVKNPDSIEAMTPEKDRMVSGTFVNVETPGQPAKICLHLYRGMNFFSKVFLDGEKATIPLSVARFINERCSHETHKWQQDEDGNPIKGSTFRTRYKFMPDF